ncbi:hypothetical protein CP966_02395 [Streptomyces galilaeus]|nr:hypothetical protein CP966_02395 [Streptomyces galilaeus]
MPAIAVGPRLPGDERRHSVGGPVHLRELTCTPVESPTGTVQIGDEVTVVVRVRRRLALSRRQASSDHR